MGSLNSNINRKFDNPTCNEQLLQRPAPMTEMRLNENITFGYLPVFIFLPLNTTSQF